MIKISAELNRVLFDAIHGIVGMACDRGVPLPYFGICRNVYHILDRTEEAHFLAYTVLADIFKDMGLCRSYPIPPTTVLFEELWEGSQFKLRMDLCSKLMSYLDIQLVQTIFSEKHETLLPALKALSFLPTSAMPWIGMGICGNVGDLMVDPTGIYYELEDIFREMGFENPVAPIGYPLGLKWVGEEGIARRQLLADLISFLEGLENVPA